MHSRNHTKGIFRGLMEDLHKKAGLEITTEDYAKWAEFVDSIIEQAKAEIMEKLNGKI